MSTTPAASPKGDKAPADHEILKQSWFKSVGPRTYAAQVKKAGNGNHFLVLTEGKRDEATGEVRKTRLFLFSEDFAAFFKMMHETAVFIRENPVPDDVKNRQARKWAKANGNAKGAPPSPRRGNGGPGRNTRRPGAQGENGGSGPSNRRFQPRPPMNQKPAPAQGALR